MNIGEMFKDRYKIIDILGQGGMSKVYLAENIKLSNLWAIKEVRKEAFAKFNPAAEADILKKIEHPALPRIFDILEDEECVYIIMDYIVGVTLDKKLSAEGPFPEDTVICWALQLCNVLDCLHSQKPNPVIYRDMKPSNIMLTAAGKIKLIDFGTAREYKDQSSNDTVYIGTKGYAAPEQYGYGQTTAATDIYSLGITLRELLTGLDPNEQAENPLPMRNNDGLLSREMERILLKCTRQKPEERYGSVSELKAELEKLQGALLEKDNELKKIWSGIKKLCSGLFAGKPAVFKKLVITVWDNAEFGCELAYTAAKLSGFNVILIDMDLLAPKADIFLGIKKYPQMAKNSHAIGKTGLMAVMEALDKNCFSYGLLLEAAVRRREVVNLYILTGCYNLSDYEYFSEKNAVKLMENAYLNFDLTILLVNKSIYDSFTICALLKSDYNLVAIRPDMDKLREFNSYIAFLKEKQKIPVEKTKFVAYEYRKNIDIGYGVIKEAVGNNFLGSISYSRNRSVLRNLHSTYAKHMEKHVTADYAKILSALNIIKNTGRKGG